MTTIDFRAPSFMATAGELLTPLEFAKLMVAVPSLLQQKRGQGQAVIVLPGFGTSDLSTSVMRSYLSWLGYHVNGWGLGRNTGNIGQLLPLVMEQLNETYLKGNAKVTIIGWSLGGVIARELARAKPEQIQQVITMGSPILGGPKATSFAKFYENQGANLDAIEARIARRESNPITVPITSIYSKRDGIVTWKASIDEHNAHADNIEVKTTHLGLGISADVFKVLASKLSSIES